MTPANLKVCGVRALTMLVALATSTAANAQVNFIENSNNALYLDANPNTQGNGSQVYMWEGNGSPQQKWRLKGAGNGLYFIENSNNALYLDANPNTQGNGSQLYLWEGNGSPQQKWRLKPTN